MLVPKSARKKVYLHLFNNGVMVAKKVQKKKQSFQKHVFLNQQCPLLKDLFDSLMIII